MPEKKDSSREPNNSGRPFSKFLSESKRLLPDIKHGLVGVGIGLPVVATLSYLGVEAHKVAIASSITGFVAVIESYHQFVPRALDKVEDYLEYILFP